MSGAHWRIYGRMNCDPEKYKTEVAWINNGKECPDILYQNFPASESHISMSKTAKLKCHEKQILRTARLKCRKKCRKM